jgi:hypothetical protein
MIADSEEVLWPKNKQEWVYLREYSCGQMIIDTKPTTLTPTKREDEIWGRWKTYRRKQLIDEALAFKWQLKEDMGGKTCLANLFHCIIIVLEITYLLLTTAVILLSLWLFLISVFVSEFIISHSCVSSSQVLFPASTLVVPSKQVPVLGFFLF